MMFGGYRYYFSGVILGAVFPVVFYVLISLFKDTAKINYEKLSLIMKIDMFFGIIAFYFGLL